jgi:hypothetical protein
MAAGMGSAVAADGDIVLRISGDAGSSFTADCTLKSADGESSFTLAEPLPFERQFAGSGLRCRVTASGAIEVEVLTGGNRSRTRSSGGAVTVSVGS